MKKTENRTLIKRFLHNETNTFSYAVYKEYSKHGVIIDPVLDYNPKNGTISHEFAKNILDFVKSNSLQIDWILETHAHADHLSAAQFFKNELGCDVAIGERIKEVQKTFAQIFHLKDLSENVYFDKLLTDGEFLMAGDLEVLVLSTPGHTPACCSFKIDDNIFVGDTIFMPDVGSARCDFPGGDAATLFDSVQKIFSFPHQTNILMCHDYPKDREHNFLTTIKAQFEKNIHLNKYISKEMFIDVRNKRDSALESPNLLLPAIQINIRAGNLPKAESNGISYLKIPLKIK